MSVGKGQRVTRLAAPLRHQVSALLREDIAAGEWAPGDRLIERELCERYGVSRTVIREALRQVEADGLITMVPQRGPVVAQVSLEDARSLYEARAVLEALAGKLFAERATDADREALGAAVDDVEEAMSGADIRTVLATKDRFYDVLLDGAANSIISSTLRTLHARIQMMRALSMTAPGRHDRTLRELRQIVEAVDARDGDAAWRACEAHVQAAAAVALARLESERPDD
ncbi:MAG: FCD domain-containing protein [Propionibacteriales bacterium]|nr:FCD domain-containing protein [Propionibacteriales bacterium]